MRIIYDDKEAKKKKGFFFYFQLRDHMYECEEMLFGERKRKERAEKLGPIAEDLKKLTKNAEDNIMFYVILKLLAEKEKAKAEKQENESENQKEMLESQKSESIENEIKNESFESHKFELNKI